MRKKYIAPQHAIKNLKDKAMKKRPIDPILQEIVIGLFIYAASAELQMIVDTALEIIRQL